MATVFFVKGNVAFGSAERNRFQPVTLQSRIHDGNTVHSLNGASINLAFVPGAFARISGDSEIKVEELRMTKDGNQTAGGMRDRSARIRLIRGEIIVLLNRSYTSKSQFAITTRQVTVNPDSDCLFCLWTDGATTRVTCARGEVTAPGDTQPPVAIAAGYCQHWPGPSKKPLAAAGDAAAQADVAESLKAGAELLNQAAGWENRRPQQVL